MAQKKPANSPFHAILVHGFTQGMTIYSCKGTQESYLENPDYLPAGTIISPVLHFDGNPYVANMIIMRANNRLPLDVSDIEPAPNLWWTEAFTLYCAWALENPLMCDDEDHDAVAHELCKLTRPTRRFLPITLGQTVEVPAECHVMAGVPPWSRARAPRAVASNVPGLNPDTFKALKDDLSVRHGEFAAMYQRRTPGARSYLVACMVRDRMELQGVWEFMMRRANHIGMVESYDRISDLYQTHLKRLRKDDRSPKARRTMDDHSVQRAILDDWLGESVSRVEEHRINGQLRYQLCLDEGEHIMLPPNILRQQGMRNAILAKLQRVIPTRSEHEWCRVVEAITKLAEPPAHVRKTDIQAWLRDHLHTYLSQHLRSDTHNDANKLPYVAQSHPSTIFYRSHHLEDWIRERAPHVAHATRREIQHAMLNIGAFHRNVWHNGKNYMRNGIHFDMLKPLGIIIKGISVNNYGTHQDDF